MIIFFLKCKPCAYSKYLDICMYSYVFNVFSFYFYCVFHFSKSCIIQNKLVCILQIDMFILYTVYIVCICTLVSSNWPPTRCVFLYTLL